MRCGFWWTQIELWARDYGNIQYLAVRLIYAQICCGLIGSLGSFFNGVLLANLGISLFALIAIESSSQNLARTYAVLLFSSILLDISWLFLFSHYIWHFPSENYGTSVSFSVKLTLVMQMIGLSVRLSSSLLWIQMYRLGVSNVDNLNPRDTDADLRNSFVSPATPSIVRHPAGFDDDVVGGSMYDPAYYSSLFGDSRNGTCSHGVGQNNCSSVVDSVSPSETSSLNLSLARIKDDENAVNKLRIV
ncbi:hypothetical protein ACJIZ3_017652 [Penstemon smallii]|uniref:Uncharacterized protein n=1 Tax=Penstemon smallii TaxID=265156 RepID=A0ABD3SWX7_9LAMI